AQRPARDFGRLQVSERLAQARLSTAPAQPRPHTRATKCTPVLSASTILPIHIQSHPIATLGCSASPVRCSRRPHDHVDRRLELPHPRTLPLHLCLGVLAPLAERQHLAEEPDRQTAVAPPHTRSLAEVLPTSRSNARSTSRSATERSRPVGSA